MRNAADEHNRERFGGRFPDNFPITELDRYVLESYGRLTMEALGILEAMTVLHERLRDHVKGANRAATAKAHIDALKDELASIEEAYGLNLLLQQHT